MARLKRHYDEVVRDRMKERFGYKNPHQIPKLDKIVINMGVGEAVADRKKLDSAMNELGKITGQKPAICPARKSVANFKLRKGMPIGCKVTLRRELMYEFLDRLLTIALPRMRDFRGVSPKSFDGRGNYALGVKEQIIFPEINYDEVTDVRGMDVVICTTAGTNDEAKSLLEMFDLPFRK